MSELPPPLLAPVAIIRIQVAGANSLGTLQGRERRFVPILGGSIEGTGLCGSVLPGGSDIQLLRPGGLLEIDARYVIDCGRDGQVMAHHRALRRMPADAGGAVYFRGTLAFEAPEGRLAWLNESIFIASGQRRDQQVELALYQVA